MNSKFFFSLLLILVFPLFIVLLSGGLVRSQGIVDTLQLLNPSIDVQGLRDTELIRLTKEEIVSLKLRGLSVYYIEGSVNVYCWGQDHQKTFQCDWEIGVVKVGTTINSNTFCLACFKDQELISMGVPRNAN